MKKCIMCGCNMDDKHDGDVCECCLEEIEDPEEIKPDFLRKKFNV